MLKLTASGRHSVYFSNENIWMLHMHFLHNPVSAVSRQLTQTGVFFFFSSQFGDDKRQHVLSILSMPNIV